MEDEGYGSDGALRRWLEGRERRYVLGVPSNETVQVARTATQPARYGTVAGLLAY